MATKKKTAKKVATAPVTASAAKPKKKIADASLKEDWFQGVDLVELVIARVTAERFAFLGEGAKPRPLSRSVLDELVFPDGSALSPSLRRWLAFDAAWLGWFDDLDRPVFKPKKLGQYAYDEYRLDWGYGTLESKITGDCFGLRFGSDSRRFLYVGKPDSIGEHPVLLADVDDSPYLGVEYPGIDVYLAIHSGLIEHNGNYGSLADTKAYGARMKEHAKLNLLRKPYIDLGYEVCNVGDPTTVAWSKDDPVPAGHRVGVHPLTGKPILLRV